jgi:integrase
MDLCMDFICAGSRLESEMAKQRTLTPASIDALQQGNLADHQTPGLSIEVLTSGKKRWLYRRRLAGKKVTVAVYGGRFPAQSIADARQWAGALNAQIDAGIDPREAHRAELARATMTVAKAHDLYMQAVRAGRASRAKRKNKPRTIKDKLEIYNRDIAPKLGRKSMYEVTEADLIQLVNAKGRTAKVRANRLLAELKVFFGWAASLRGSEVGLESDPALRLRDLKFPEAPRDRSLSLEELGWFLRGLAKEEEFTIRRGLLVILLTAARRNEVIHARSTEVSGKRWTIPAGRVKNSCAHTIQLGPWGQQLMGSNSEWIFPAARIEGPRKTGWYEARNRIYERMIAYAGKPLARFSLHDLRRTARSNTKRLKVDFDTAEAMLNHVKAGMERIYDLYDLDDEKADGFLKWENEIIRIARNAGAADRLSAPVAPEPCEPPSNETSPFWSWPVHNQSAGVVLLTGSCGFQATN